MRQGLRGQPSLCLDPGSAEVTSKFNLLGESCIDGSPSPGWIRWKQPTFSTTHVGSLAGIGLDSIQI